MSDPPSRVPLRDTPPAEGATPALAQWFAAKAAHPDAIVFFRMGDFFELFFGDAHAAAPVLDIAISHRGEHRGQPVPMAGVPVHAWEAYLARLIRAGFRVAVCDQVETPEQAKARKAPTIRREVVRVVTPATVTEDGLLDAARPAWLLALAEGEGGLGAAWLDVSTGAFCTAAMPRADFPALLARLEPVEAVVAPTLAELPDLARLAGRLAARDPARDPARIVREAYGVATLDGFGRFEPPELAAAALALSYVRETQAGTLPRLDPPRPEGAAPGVLMLDAPTRRSLEILRDGRGGTEATLLTAVDRTVTAAGARELAARLSAPLAELAPIAARHDAVSFLLGAEAVREAVRAALKGSPDLARALARIALDRFTPRDFGAIRAGLNVVAKIAAALTEAPLPLPERIAAAAEALRLDPALPSELDRGLSANLPARLEDGGVIAAGYDGELDALRRLRDGAREAIAALQSDLAQAWGVASLKIRHHQQFGFLAEVPAAAGQKLVGSAAVAGAMAPIHRQTMANAMRFTCAALAELDRKVAEAGERAAARERACIRHLRKLILDAGTGVAEAARALAELDVHAAAATLAVEGGWCRPEMPEVGDARAEFCITAGRHPVVEAALRRARGPAFVPNDCDLSPGRRLCLLTGPNMAGKSTWLRQNALMVVLAQSGLFVPAASARIGLVDRLFSRVGGGDDIAGGRSTFMVEMAETAAILNGATARSLVVLDEVGRGTATWDGLAIAWAVLEALHDRIRCRAVFATHFHELTALAGRLPEVALASMKVREWRGEVVFQHLVGPGAAERSWGVHVARLAGVPRPVLARASQVLAALEARARAGGPDTLAEELPLFARGVQETPPSPSPLADALAEINPDTLSPREAHETLYRLKTLFSKITAPQHENTVPSANDKIM